MTAVIQLPLCRQCLPCPAAFCARDQSTRPALRPLCLAFPSDEAWWRRWRCLMCVLGGACGARVMPLPCAGRCTAVVPLHAARTPAHQGHPSRRLAHRRLLVSSLPRLAPVLRGIQGPARGIQGPARTSYRVLRVLPLSCASASDFGQGPGLVHRKRSKADEAAVCPPPPATPPYRKQSKMRLSLHPGEAPCLGRLRHSWTRLVGSGV